MYQQVSIVPQVWTSYATQGNLQGKKIIKILNLKNLKEKKKNLKKGEREREKEGKHVLLTNV